MARRSRPLEADIRDHFTKSCERRGLFQIKLEGITGIADRLIIYRGRAWFVELKRPGETPRESQIIRMKEIARQTQAPSRVVSTKAEVDDLLEEICTS